VEAQPLKPRALDLIKPPSAAQVQQQQQEQQEQQESQQESQQVLQSPTLPFTHAQLSRHGLAGLVPPPLPFMALMMSPRPDLRPGKHLTAALPAVPSAAAPDNGDMHKVVLVPVGML
jgi:hypothetical protein